jgi:exopolysaccharide biosynthesis polyprenyl glycosylphosphotransferase
MLMLLLVVPFSQHLLRAFHVYDSHRVGGAGDAVRNVISTQVIGCGVFLSVSLAMGGDGLVMPLVRFFGATAGVLALEKICIYVVLRRLRRLGYDQRNVCIVATWDRAQEFARQFADHPEWGLNVACVAAGAPEHRSFALFSSREHLADDFEELLKKCVVDEVLIAAQADELPAERRAAWIYERYGIQVRMLLVNQPGEAAAAPVEDFHGAPAMSVTPAARTERDLAVKRIFDLVISFLMLVLVTLPMLLIAVMVKLSSSGPVFFRQTRVGMNGRRFRMIKFRTMVDGAESLARDAHRSITRGPIFKDPNDYRITPIGRWLRRFSLDELPQLFNVLMGHMSLVGPRPLPVYEADRVTGESRRRFSVPPGITCVWQVTGRNDVAYERWMEYDLQYVDKWSLWCDTLLLLRTVPAVLWGKGAY